MTFNVALSALLVLFAISVCVTATGVRADAASDEYYDGLITVANGTINRENYAKTFSLSLQAIETNPKRYEAYYFAALALYRQRLLERSLGYARDSLDRVGDSPRRNQVVELLARIERALQAIENGKNGEQAEASGELEVAASRYQEGFEADPSQHKLGWAAVRMWMSIKDPGKAARILRILSASDDDATLREATKQLAELASKLAELSDTNLRQGWMHLDELGPLVYDLKALQSSETARGQVNNAIACFERSIEADPQRGGVDSPYIGLLVARAAISQKEMAMQVLRSAARNKVTPDSIEYFNAFGKRSLGALGFHRLILLGPLFCELDMQEAMHTIYGNLGMNLARQTCQDFTLDRAKNKAAFENFQRKDKLYKALSELVGTCHSGTRRGVTACICLKWNNTADVGYRVSIRGTGNRLALDDEGTARGEQEAATYGIGADVIAKILPDSDFQSAMIHYGAEVFEATRGQNEVRKVGGDVRSSDLRNGGREMQKSIFDAYGSTLHFAINTNIISLGSSQSEDLLATERVSACPYP